MTNSGSKGFAEALRERFSERALSIAVAHGEVTLEVAPADWVEVATALRDEPAFAFAQLIDLAGVDYLGFGHDEWATNAASWEGFSRGVEGDSAPGRFDWAQRPRDTMQTHRFAVAVQLLSLEHNRRLRLRCYCDDDAMPLVPTLTEIWPVANWFEREAFDLFGVIFDGHPDLRRLLTDYGFVGHPFRKDFPLIGNVEVRYDPKAQRVIYEPVTSVVPRVTVARVIRDDVDLQQARAEAADNWREN